MSVKCATRNTDWDINDTSLPKFSVCQNFEEWVDGHSRLVYNVHNDQAKKHASGWAMRNTNNHNVQILKKSCLGVLVCSQRCILDNGQQVHVRPAICDKARKKQQGKPCPNRDCNGRLQVLPCRGHCGYPVTHFWRHQGDFILFQSKGNHDHPRPEPKSSSEMKRMATLKALKNASFLPPNYPRKYSKLRQISNNPLGASRKMNSLVSIEKTVLKPTTKNLKSENVHFSQFPSFHQSNCHELDTKRPLIDQTGEFIVQNSPIEKSYSNCDSFVPYCKVSSPLVSNSNQGGKYTAANYAKAIASYENFPSTTESSLNGGFTLQSIPQSSGPLSQIHLQPTSSAPNTLYTQPNMYHRSACNTSMFNPSSFHLSSSLSSSSCSSMDPASQTPFPLLLPPPLHSAGQFLPQSSSAISSVPSSSADIYNEYSCFGNYSTSSYVEDNQKGFQVPTPYVGDMFNQTAQNSSLPSAYQNSLKDAKRIDSINFTSPHTGIENHAPQSNLNERADENSLESSFGIANHMPVLQNPTADFPFEEPIESIEPIANQFGYSNQSYFNGQISSFPAHKPFSVDSQNHSETRSSYELNLTSPPFYSTDQFFPKNGLEYEKHAFSPKTQIPPLIGSTSVSSNVPIENQENGWKLDHLDAYYAKDILTLESPIIKQGSTPQSSQLLSSFHQDSHMLHSLHYEQLPYADPAEINTCNSDDYVVTFLK